MSKSVVVCICVAIATLFGHYTINQQRRLDESVKLLEYADKRESISSDQIRDLIADLQQASLKLETTKAEGYVAGVVDATNRPDHYAKIWHSGYDRGSSVQKDMDTVVNASLKSKD